MDSAKGMAVAGWAVLSDETVAQQVRREFEDGMGEGGAGWLLRRSRSTYILFTT